MKLSILNKALWGSAVAVSVALLPFALPAKAQTDTTPGSTTTAPTDDTGVVESEDDGFDWGLLGLLGLAGLAGLARKKDDRTVYHDPINPAATTRSDYTNPR